MTNEEQEEAEETLCFVIAAAIFGIVSEDAKTAYSTLDELAKEL